MTAEADKKAGKDLPAMPRPAMRRLLAGIAMFYAIGLAVLLLIVTVWLASDILLLVMASILVAVVLRGTANMMMQWLKLPPGLALALVLLLVSLVIGLASYFLSPRIVSQGAQLFVALPESIARLSDFLSGNAWFRQLISNIPPVEDLLPDFAKVLAQARAIFSGAFGIIAKLAIVVFVGVYLAAQPKLYIRGVLKLFPVRHRPRAREVLHELGETLKLWLLGKLVGMVVVGTATGVALGVLGVPLAATLGLITGILNFIPYLGPVLAGIPMVLIAFAQDPTLALYVLVFYVVLQLAESYFLTPFVDRRTVYLPPALTIIAQVFMGVFFGLLGITLATPLVAIVYVLVATLYVQDVLGDKATMPSERD